MSGTSDFHICLPISDLAAVAPAGQCVRPWMRVFVVDSCLGLRARILA